jgi:hypothetical protein
LIECYFVLIWDYRVWITIVVYTIY